MSTIVSWWHEYLRVLREPTNRLGNLDRLNQITTDLIALGVVRAGCPMPRAGAEDLARECDALLVKRGAYVQVPHV